MHRFAHCLPLVVVLTGPALAQTVTEGPSFDCAKADGMATELVCADPALAALDRRLADRYAAALAAAEGLDAGADEAAGTLRAMQRGWIKGRDECWKAEDGRDCVESAYLTREAEFVAAWMLEEPVGTARLVCEGNPANEIWATFFATELPAVRVEYGDSVVAGWLVPAASGSRYALPFGRELWLKGDEARFVWPEGTAQNCMVVE